MPAAPSIETGAGHAGLMDRVYRHQRYIYDITRKFYLFGRDGLIRDLRLCPGDRLVEIGCGTGRNLIAMARLYPEARLFGLDASEEMLKTAAAQIRRAGLAERITLVQGLAEQLDPTVLGQDGFEHVLFSYSLSMIPDWRGALTAGRSALVPGGRIHMVDFGDLAGFSPALRRLMASWLALFHVSPRTDLLGEIERTLQHQGRLRLLPGRYAFAFSCQQMSKGNGSLL
jgi:S-adenosylmethionine-diacylgycerolhomoserine-N-methlytransferase